MDTVILFRALRSGGQTEEIMPRWLAELTLACVPSDEPNTARAIIRPYRPMVNPRSIYRNVNRPSTYVAMQLGRILWSNAPGGLQA